MPYVHPHAPVKIPAFGMPRNKKNCVIHKPIQKQLQLVVLNLKVP